MAVTQKRNIIATRSNISSDVEKTRTINFVISTNVRDRHNTVLNQDNWHLDNYRKNPIVAYQHNLSGGLFTDPNPDSVIGRSPDLWFEGSGKDKKLLASVKFEPAEINPLAERIFRKVLFGSLSQASVGFLEVGTGKYGEGSEAKGRDKETYYFSGQELLEWSIVSIPSNPEAGKRISRMMRQESPEALMYAVKELYVWTGLKPSQIESMATEDVLILMTAKDLELYEKDPSKIRSFLSNPVAMKERAERLRIMMESSNNAPIWTNRYYKQIEFLKKSK
jgi:hypothetical protein